MPWRRGKKRRKKNQMESLIPGLFQPAFRDLWEFRSLTPHAFFEPKGSYDRCTVLTRKRWMLSEEKRIGLSSQKMRERGKREKSLWNCLSFVHVTLCSVLHSNSENKKREREREMDYDVPYFFVSFLGWFSERNVYFLLAQGHICMKLNFFVISLTHKHIAYKALYI